MKTAIPLIVASIAAFLYFKPSPEAVEPSVVNSVPAPSSNSQRAVVVAPAAVASAKSRWKSGADAQTDLTLNTNRWKPAQNGSTNLTANTDRWRTGPNAQTGLTSNTDRWNTGPNAQSGLPPNTERWKTGPNAQTNLGPN